MAPTWMAAITTTATAMMASQTSVTRYALPRGLLEGLAAALDRATTLSRWRW